jgi:hypothetical protein
MAGNQCSEETLNKQRDIIKVRVGIVNSFRGS